MHLPARTFGLSVLVAAVSLIAGCTPEQMARLAPEQAPVAANEEPATAAPQQPKPKPKRPVPRPKPALAGSEPGQPEPSQPSEAEAASPLLTPDASTVPAAAALDAPVQVAGLSPDETRALLGPPASETDTAPTRVWRYTARDCAVDVYFVFDVARNAFQALHVEPAPTEPPSKAGSNDTESCLRKVRDAAASRS
jgi:hypothetical protein